MGTLALCSADGCSGCVDSLCITLRYAVQYKFLLCALCSVPLYFDKVCAPDRSLFVLADSVSYLSKDHSPGDNTEQFIHSEMHNACVLVQEAL